MKTPIQEVIEMINKEIDMLKPSLPIDNSARNWFDALNLAVGVMIHQGLPKEKQVIEKSFLDSNATMD